MKIDRIRELSLEEKKDLLESFKQDIKFCNTSSVILGYGSLLLEMFTIYEGFDNYLYSGSFLTGDYNIKINGCFLAISILSYIQSELELEKLHNKSLLLEKDINES